MAIDEALLNSFDPKISKPILRIYGWNSPSLSLGRFQNSAEVLDLVRCRADALSVVRRVSGGGAIYHADELTYSIVCSPEHIPAATSVKDSFRILTGFLMGFYRNLGLAASYAVDSGSDLSRFGTRTDFCFAGKESFDIMINEKKIGGNAQRRRKSAIFQHGSIPIVNRAAVGLAYMKNCTPAFAECATSLRDNGITSDVSVLNVQLIDAFKMHMGVNMQVSQLTHEEQELVRHLTVDKFATDRWNLRGDEA